MNFARHGHACMADDETGTIHVLGGSRNPLGAIKSGVIPLTTEILKLNENEWKIGSNLPRRSVYSAAVASRYPEYIGYLAGGHEADDGRQSTIFGLERGSLKWVELSINLTTKRARHTLVNVDKIPGC